MLTNKTEKKLDKIFEQANFEPPFLLKIDTEGFELEVINGAKEVLKNTIFVILKI